MRTFNISCSSKVMDGEARVVTGEVVVMVITIIIVSMTVAAPLVITVL